MDRSIAVTDFRRLWPIYIPSKGRPDGQTFKLLQGMPYKAVIEPQDEKAYREQGIDSLLVLAKNDEGLCYSRNFILEHAQAIGNKWIWMIDDDISSIGTIIKARFKKCDALIPLMDAQIIVNQPNCAIGAMQYQQFAWSAKSPASPHARCESVTALQVQHIADLRYRFRLKHDKDMVAQVHERGMISIRSNWTAFANKFSDNPGGLHSEYETRKDENAAREVFAAWPNRARMEENSRGRLDVLLDYRGIYLDALRRIHSAK
jgi:glycosyltransferase involved in cell wall biosynthesis